ncbi:MAG: hypothetical protein IT537_29620 [Hyphomicrobiales bacterium]|nr:hypothetical protein [Hyphomicrobiales bacterium]
MATTVTVFDETTSGERAGALTLEFLTERVTVRELIRSRVYQEVTEYNARLPKHPGVPVQPSEAERLLNGERARPHQRLDWLASYDKALKSFAGNGFLLFVGDRQLLDLDEEVDLHYDTSVAFLKLVPLVGG